MIVRSPCRAAAVRPLRLLCWRDMAASSQAVLPKAVKHLAKSADQKTARSLKRLACIWEERRVFGGSGLPHDLKEAVRDAGAGKDTAPGVPPATHGGAISSEKTLMALQHRVHALTAVRAHCAALIADRFDGAGGGIS
jgi:hypothetical protein